MFPLFQASHKDMGHPLRHPTPVQAADMVITSPREVSSTPTRFYAVPPTGWMQPDQHMTRPSPVRPYQGRESPYVNQTRGGESPYVNQMRGGGEKAPQVEVPNPLSARQGTSRMLQYPSLLSMNNQMHGDSKAPQISSSRSTYHLSEPAQVSQKQPHQQQPHHETSQNYGGRYPADHQHSQQQQDIGHPLIGHGASASHHQNQNQQQQPMWTAAEVYNTQQQPQEQQQQQQQQPQQQQQSSQPPHENATFGVGIEFASGRRELIVSSLVPGCSAQVNGTIRVGDELIEAVGVTGIDFKQARDLILGRQGTSVNLRFRRDSQTYPVTLIRGNSDYIQLEHKHQALVKENENLRLQLRRQNDESEAQRKHIEEGKSLHKQIAQVQIELKSVTTEKDSLLQELKVKRSILQEQSVQIQEMGALKESLRSQSARVDQLEQELSATQRAQEEFNREFGKRSLSSSSSSSSSLFTSNEEKWREKLSKLMQHKIDALHEIENLKSENESLKSTLKSCQTALLEAQIAKGKQLSHSTPEQEREKEKERKQDSPVIARSWSPYINAVAPSPLPFRHHASPNTPRQFMNTNGHHQVASKPMVPYPSISPAHHLVAKPQYSAPVRPQDQPRLTSDQPRLSSRHQDQPRLTSLPAPSVVFRKEEISDLRQSQQEIVESWEVAPEVYQRTGISRDTDGHDNGHDPNGENSQEIEQLQC